ncbi:MAG: DUF4442 domain-containing protein [Planctomycetes bacterium]|nr:DUF4442 domain-containing protein [Planctomycetota bacterium]
MPEAPAVFASPAALGLDRAAIDRVRLNLLTRWRLAVVFLTRLPMGLFAGLRVRELTDELCRVTVRYRWRNRNPFGSTYWAVLGMAAELASGALVIQYTNDRKPSIATLVTGVSARFLKKAVGETTFLCDAGRLIASEIEQAIATGQPREFVTEARGVAADGQPVAEFSITWSVKVRTPK